nr:hypothetical protein [Tanacetum cinerariifolium]
MMDMAFYLVVEIEDSDEEDSSDVENSLCGIVQTMTEYLTIVPLVTNLKKIDNVSVRIRSDSPIKLVLPNHLHAGTLDTEIIGNRELDYDGGVGVTVLVLDHMGWSSGSITVMGRESDGVSNFVSDMSIMDVMTHSSSMNGCWT